MTVRRAAQLKADKKIASGAYGTVYAGRYAGVPVALKEIYYSIFDAAVVDDFFKEAALLSSLHHPRILCEQHITTQLAVWCLTLPAPHPFPLAPGACMGFVTSTHTCTL